MLKFFLYVILFFVAATLQSVVVPQIEIWGAQPSLLLILTVMIALRHGTLAGCFCGFISGLLCDVYGPVEWLGAYSLSYCIVGFALGQIEESFIDLNLLPGIFVLAFADFFKDIIYYFAIGKAGDDILQALISLSAKNAVYTLCIGAVCFYLFSPRKQRKIEIYNQQGLL
ncbi:MAG: rod shape-determining protein MreD [Candidatus Fibromonas sp.]|jgi:rod shape-determining protein MreD|nr:rod shape-determining protein MreD [Candidatus Fibromonas sp.]